MDGPIPVPIDDLFLAENVQHICVCDTGIESFVSIDSVSVAKTSFTKLTLGYNAHIFAFVDVCLENRDILLFWQVKPVVHVFQVCFYY